MEEAPSYCSNLNKQVSEILTEQQIIRDVAKELDISEDNVKAHMGFFKDFMEELMWRDDVHTIFIPHLGTMYKNLKACASIAIREKREVMNDKRTKIVEKAQRDVDYLLKELPEFENFSLHGYRKRLHNVYFTCGKNRKDLQKFQNDEGKN